MITYDTLKELAQALSKVTGYRYVAFCESITNDLLIYFSNMKMTWHPQPRFWTGESDGQVLDLGDLPFLDWCKCQFDCKEEK